MDGQAARASSKWFSENPDKAWGEKFFLTFVPFFLIYNTLIMQLHWIDVGNVWQLVQGIGIWVPYCLLLPAFLRRNSGVVWYESYWFKFNVYIAVYIFYATYFGTEYFFQILGFHYNFPHVTWLFDSYNVGPSEAVALAQHKKVPVSMYLTAIAFFIVYHTLAVVAMRRTRNLFAGQPHLVRSVAWVVIVVLAAWFFGWGEPNFMNNNAAMRPYSWYDDIAGMLKIGAFFYALFFIVSFPNVFRLDEWLDRPRWTISRTIIEASFVWTTVMFLLDLWGWIIGPVR